MLTYLLRQLANSFGIFFRTIRAFFTRKLVGLWAYLRRITNFSRHATKVATASFQGAATAVKKPTKREDYIETQRLFISKSFLIMLAIGLVVLGLLVYFVVWPFLLSHFFTARFYQGDPQLTDWSGRVVVCYDEAKKHPMYRGTLENGVLQGKGTEYDEEGLLIYEGNFVDGLRSGNGKLYEAGVLVYEGEFSGGEINGTGTAYVDGVKRYQGAFVNGLYEGEGTSYYASGAKAYSGSFAAGLYEGEGTEYDEEEQVRYKGSFASGLYEGEGVLYGEDGEVYYKGSFAKGLYDGSGVIYLSDGDQIRAEFSAGVTTGVIQWYQEGKLWYDGSADNLTPDGFGTLYSESGKVVYAGEFDRGTLDGAWILSLTAAELREAFGDAAVTETDGTDGFLIVNETLGLTALCSYQQGEEETQVYRLWFAPEENSLYQELLPWANGSEAAAWARTGEAEQMQESVFQGAILQPDGTVDGDWYQQQYSYGDYVCLLLSIKAGAAPVQLCWSKDMTQAGGVTVDSESAQAQERLESLLAALDGAGGSSSSSSGTSSLGDVERLLGLMLTAEDGEALVDALIDYYIYGEMASCLTASQPLLQQSLAEAQTRLERGDATQDDVDAAQSALDDLDRRLAQYKTAQEQAELTVQELSKLSASDYELAPVILTFDPLELDVSALCSAAVTYAESVAAGRYEVDTAALEREIKSAVLELGLAYESIRTARDTAVSAAAQVEETTQAYAKGTADKAELYSAQCARDETAASLYQAMGTFAHQANGLNTLSGGWLASQYDWMSDTFAALFQSEILRGEEAARQEEEDRAQREEEAAQAIQEEQAAEEEAAQESQPPQESQTPQETQPSQPEAA